LIILPQLEILGERKTERKGGREEGIKNKTHKQNNPTNK
jgi:hypothetical protein